MKFFPVWALLLFQVAPGMAPPTPPAPLAPTPTGLDSADPAIQIRTARSLGQKGDVAAHGLS